MSSTPARGWRWWLSLAGLLLLVALPWLQALAPWETQVEFSLVVVLTVMAGTLGLVYTAGFIVILVHEGGHWLAGRLVGIRLSHFVVGYGDSPLGFTLGGIEFSFGPWLRGGHVRDIPEREHLVFARQLVFLSGGVVAELVLMGELLLVPTPAPGPFATLRLFILVTAGLGIWASVWPRMVWVAGRLGPNDALLIRQAWQNRHRPDEIWRQYLWRKEVNELCHAHKYAEAAVVMERLRQAAPMDDQWLLALAQIHAAAGNGAQAMALHHEIIGRTEPDTGARVNALDKAAHTALHLGQREELLKLRVPLEAAFKSWDLARLAILLGAVLVEIDETPAGVELLNRSLQCNNDGKFIALANAYLAKAALRLDQPQRAAELLARARANAADHPLVRHVAAGLEPRLAGGPAPEPAATPILKPS